MSALQPLTTRQIAEEAIGLFLEFRDIHGYTEELAAKAAVNEILEGEHATEEINRWREES